MKSSRQTIFSTVLSIVITVFAVGMVVHAAPWADPTATPPGNNAAEPINISNSGQAKSGGLMLNTGGALIGLIVQNGSMGIGDVTPDAGLKLDVEGKVGATEYCDQNGNNCRAATGGGGVLTCSDVRKVAGQTGNTTCSARGAACVSYGDFGRGHHDEFYNMHCGTTGSGDAGFSWRCCKV